MTALDRLAGLVLGLKLGTLLINEFTFPRLRRAAQSLAGVAVLVPARDEEANLRVTLPGLVAQGAPVTVLDDHSTDGTATLARHLGAAVLPGETLPDGWFGKPWACQQLARQASGDVLVFTDADVMWAPGALRAAVAELRRSGADLLSVWPRQANGTLGERLLTPLVDDVLLSLLPAPLLRLPHASASAANGQVMIFRRAAYDRLGGHAAVRSDVLEDVRFARAVKAGGGRVSLALGGALVGVRMYRSYPASVRGFGKNALPLHGGSRAALLASLVLHAAVYTLPALRGRAGLVALAAVEGLLVRHLTGRTRPADLLEVAFTPLLPLLSLPVYARALRRDVQWKGRTYRQ